MTGQPAGRRWRKRDERIADVVLREHDDIFRVALPISQQPAGDFAVEEVDHLGRFADLAGEHGVGGEDKHPPAEAALAEDFPKPCDRAPSILSPRRCVRHTADCRSTCPADRGGWKPPDRAAGIPANARCPRRGPLLRQIQRIAADVIDPRSLAATAGRHAACASSRTLVHRPTSKSIQPMKPNRRRVKPGGRFRAIQAASMQSVPEPHIGSTSGRLAASSRSTGSGRRPALH